MDYKKFGVIIFDDPKEPTSGWANDGSDKVVRFIDQTELPSDILFLSNCTYDAYFSSGRRYLSNMRPSTYLDVTFADMLAEWGADVKKASDEWSARLCGAIFRDIMKMARGLLRRTCPDLSPHDYFLTSKLAQDMKVLLPAAEYPKDDTASILRTGIGYSGYTSTSVPIYRDALSIKVRRPRFDHTIDLLSTPIPNGPFSAFKGSSMGTAKDLVMLGRPVMAEVAVSSNDTGMSSIYGFGVVQSRGKRNQRAWVAHPELAAMNRFSHIDVKGVLLGTGYTALSRDLSDSIKMFLTDGGGNMSWSANILAETLWRAASVGYDSSAPLIGSMTVRPQTSWRGAWIKAADKVVTFQSALKLNNAGFRVTSYGSGWISCSVQPERIEEFVIAAFQNGLLPPMRDIERPISDRVLKNLKWGGHDSSYGYAVKILGKKDRDLWLMNRFPLISDTQERAEIIRRVTAA
jgi:hypothetical protein